MSEQLQALGLGENEALVYGALCYASPSSATHIAKACGLSRSSVYTSLSALTSKGLVGTTYKNNVKQFIAQDESALTQLLKKEQDALDKKFKLLEGMQKASLLLGRDDIPVPQVVFFEGQEGLKRIYLSMIRNAPKGSTRYLLRDEFVWRPEWKFIFEHEWSDRVRRWIDERHMRTKLLVNASQLERSKGAFYRKQKAFDLRFLPPTNAMRDFGMYIMGDTIAILSVEQGNLIGVQITNQHLAQNFKNVFEGLWHRSKTR